MTIKRKFSPVRSDDKLEYSVVGDAITVTHYKNAEPAFDETGLDITPEPVVTTELFDFTGLPDGVAEVHLFETDLPINPFVSAKRVNGILELELINYIGANASEQERFPKWEVI